MKAIILAAGRGSRMKEKTEILPKCLTKLWGKTLLEWQIQAIQKAGINDIGIITGYHSEKIIYPGITFFHNENWENTNMVATLLKADEWLQSDDCIVSYSDIIYSKTAINTLRESQNLISILYYTDFKQLWEKRFENPLEDIESFRMDEKGSLIEIGEKVEQMEDVQGQYMGLLKFSPKGWEKTKKYIYKQDLPKSIEKIDMTGLLSYLIKKGTVIKAIPYKDIWLEVDNQIDLELYQSLDIKQYDL
jgi:choline kinase